MDCIKSNGGANRVFNVCLFVTIAILFHAIVVQCEHRWESYDRCVRSKQMFATIQSRNCALSVSTMHVMLHCVKFSWKNLLLMDTLINLFLFLLQFHLLFILYSLLKDLNWSFCKRRPSHNSSVSIYRFLYGMKE